MRRKYTDDEICDMLYTRRQMLGFTLQQAADSCEVSQTCYRHYESGEKSLYAARPYTMAKLCRFLQIERCDLFCKS